MVVVKWIRPRSLEGEGLAYAVAIPPTVLAGRFLHIKIDDRALSRIGAYFIGTDDALVFGRSP